MRDKENNSTGFLFLIGLIAGVICVNSGVNIDFILSSASKILNIAFIILLIAGLICFIYGLNLRHDGKKYADSESLNAGMLLSISSIILLIVCFCVLIYFRNI